MPRFSRRTTFLSAHRRRQLTLESLESRLPMAGNVTVNVTLGELTITGDGADNEIFVGSNGNSFAVYGLGGTTLNGGVNGNVLITTVAANVQNIRVDLGAGSDRFYFGTQADWNDGSPFSQGWSDAGFKPLLHTHGLGYLAGQLDVDLGDGFDTAVISGSVGERLQITGGTDSGDDGVFIRTDASQQTGQVQIDLGNGNNHAAVALENVAGPVSLTSGLGNDTILAAFRTAPDLSITTSEGDDRVVVQGGLEFGIPQPENGTSNTVWVETAGGNDVIEITQLFANTLVVNAGSGLDTTTIRGINLAGDIRLTGGGTLGSSIELTDLGAGSVGKIDANQSAFQWGLVTHISGSASVNFNFDPYTPDPHVPSGAYVVALGEQYLAPGRESSGGFVVESGVTVYGTIYEDEITLKGVKTAAVSVDGGYGEDTIALKAIEVSGNATVLLGDGNDRGLVVEDAVLETPPGVSYDMSAEGVYRRTYIGGDLRIDYGSGNERIVFPSGGGHNIEQFAIGARWSGLTKNFVVDGKLEVEGGAGQNDLSITAAAFNNAAINLGGSATWLAMRVFSVRQDLAITGGSGTDDWYLTQFGVGRNLSVNTSEGDDHFELRGDVDSPSSIQGQFSLDSGAGNDFLTLGNVGLGGNPGGDPITTVKRVSVDSGTGNDTVQIGRIAQVDFLMAQLGSGDDSLYLTDNFFSGSYFMGGDGSDTVDGVQPPLNGVPATYVQFETKTVADKPLAIAHG